MEVSPQWPVNGKGSGTRKHEGHENTKTGVVTSTFVGLAIALGCSILSCFHDVETPVQARTAQPRHSKKGGDVMKKLVMLVGLLGVAMLTVGCTSKVGLIALETRPPGATVHLDQNMIGETPLSFEFNMERPATLKIEKTGYYPKTENLTVGWVKSEYQRGNFTEGVYTINGSSQKAWEVRAVRDLIRME
jgi:hypothetical protein